jgi:hypothetical protein
MRHHFRVVLVGLRIRPAMIQVIHEEGSENEPYLERTPREGVQEIVRGTNENR